MTTGSGEVFRVSCRRAPARATGVTKLAAAFLLLVVSAGESQGADRHGPARARGGPAAREIPAARPVDRKARLGAAAPLWSAYPLYGGEMTAIATDPGDPQIAYVGTRDAGVFRTTDGGASWQPI